MRLWQLIRDRDVSGVSGIGRVAEVVELENGKVVVAWLPHLGPSSVAVFNSLAEVLEIHGHGGATRLELARCSIRGCRESFTCDVCREYDRIAA